MRSRLFMLLFGLGMLPAAALAIIPTADVPGTFQAATEVGNTINSVKESLTQNEQLQKTMAAIGTAKKTVSGYVSDAQEKLNELKEKAEKYKAQAEEYKAKAEAYKAEVESQVNAAKDKYNEVKSQAEGAVNKANQIKGQVEGAVAKAGEIKGQVESAVAKAGELKDQVEGAVAKAGEIKNQITGGEALAEAETTAEAETADNETAEETVRETAPLLVDQPAAQPARRTIAVDAGNKPAEQSDNTGGQHNEITEQPEAATPQKIIRDTTIPAVRETLPVRKAFKTSAGRGYLHQRITLTFTSQLPEGGAGGSSGSQTDGDVFLTPDQMALFCGQQKAEDAAEEGAFARCLKYLNKIAYSKVSEETNRQLIEDAQKAKDNGYAEYLAASYFEALEIYNESLDFKNNMVVPVTSSQPANTGEAWIYAREMNQLLGSRLNALNRLWSRNLGLQTFALYATRNMVDEQE